MVVTCSDTRTPDNDTSGQLIMRLLKEQGHQVLAYHLVKDEPLLIKECIGEAIRTEGFTPSSSTAGQGSLDGIRHSKQWMRCWKNAWMDSEKSFGHSPTRISDHRPS